MTSEIRVNKIENRSGLGTVTFADTGVDLAGIVTATTFSGSGASLTGLPAAQLSGTLPALSAANLTNVPAANITGTLPAITAANLTNIPAANIVGVCTSGLTKTGGFGKVLQYVTGTTTTQAYLSNSGTLTDTGLTATITPASGTKILVIINQPFYVGSYNFAGDSYGTIKVLRDSTALTQQLLGHDSVSAGWFEMWSNFTFTYLDTHGANGSTAVTYKTQFSGKSSTEVYVQRGSEGYSQRANINLLEVQ